MKQTRQTGAQDIMMDAIDRHEALVADFKAKGLVRITEAVDMICHCLDRGGTVYLCGNGGSAADAQHIAGELVGRFYRNRRALSCVALTTDTSVMSAVANDFSYDDVFSRQVEALIKKDDVLWAFSTSGSSTNILKAAESARQRGAKILGFTGRANSSLESSCDVCVCAADDSSARSQEIHQLAYHIVCQLVEQRCCPAND